MKRSFLISMICVGTALLIVLAVVAMIVGSNGAPVFHDVTVELGHESLSIWDFLTDPPRRENSAFVSDVSLIDLNKPGVTTITMRHRNKLYNVTLTIQDTTAPVATFLTEKTLPLGQEAKAQDFVEDINDLSPVVVEFITAPQQTDTYSDQVVEVRVADIYGNSITGSSVLRYDWLHTNVELELGTTLTKEHILIDAEKDGDLIAQEAINEINLGGAGKYTLTVQSGDSIRNCSITIVDTMPPQVVLKQVSILPTQTCSESDFIESVYDASGDVKLELLTDLPFGQEGNHTVQFKATDKNGLSCTVQTLLRIHKDITPPSIYGLTDIKVTANAQTVPDYTKNVFARDDFDGYTEVFFDDSQVDLTTAGVYFINYTSSDSVGNVAVKQRKVTVTPDYVDTQRLVADIAKNLTATDPESLRDFVRSNIIYLASWGGEDPVAYGFTNWSGNCYVHAACFQALLEYFGYESEIIWVTNKTHYWNIIKLDGVWYHMDSTPSRRTHSRYSIMTNAQRLETLNGRRWDESQWPQLKEEKPTEKD